MDFHLYSKICTKKYTEGNSVYTMYTKETESSLIDSFLSLVFAELKSDHDLNEFDFVRLNGNIMNICEENCCFDFYCSICKSSNNLNDNNFRENLNMNSSQLVFDSANKLTMFLHLILNEKIIIFFQKVLGLVIHVVL